MLLLVDVFHMLCPARACRALSTIAYTLRSNFSDHVQRTSLLADDHAQNSSQTHTLQIQLLKRCPNVYQ